MSEETGFTVRVVAMCATIAAIAWVIAFVVATIGAK